MTTKLLDFLVLPLGAAATIATGLATLALADTKIEINFAAEIGGRSFACGQTYDGIGITNSTVEPSDFRFYISDVKLIDRRGNLTPLLLTQDGIWQTDNVALLDFEDGTGPCQNGNSALNTSIRGTAPSGDYVGLQFDMGVPFELNHDDVLLANSPLNLSAMFWNWQGGRRFLKVDMATSGRPVPPQPAVTTRQPMMQQGGMNTGMNRPMMGDEEEAAGFSVHIGSTGCAAESRTTAPEAPCQNPNLTSVRFDQFDVNTHVVVADLARVLVNTNVDVNTEDTAPGCMSSIRDPECEHILPAFGFGDGNEQQFFYRR